MNDMSPAHSAHPESAALLQEMIDQLDRWQEPLDAGYAEDDLEGRFGKTRWRTLQEAGLTGLNVDEAHDGLGLGIAETTRLLERLGEICRDGGLGFALASHLCGVCVPLGRYGDDAAKDAYLPGLASGALIGAHAITEPDSGSDAFAMKTTASRDGDDWVISGQKCFISNAPIADLIAIYTRTHPTRGALNGFSVILIERDAKGLTIGQPRKKLGLRTAPMADLYLDEVRAPASALIGREGQAYSILSHVMNWEILCVFALQVGEMRRRLRECIAYAKERKQFGQAIGSFQAIAHKLVDMRLSVETAAQWLERARVAMVSGRNAALEIGAAKLVVSEANVATALDAITIHGGAGYMAETGIEAGLRDAVGGLIYSGSSETQRNRIATMMGL